MDNLSKITFTMIAKLGVILWLVVYVGADIATKLPITGFRKDIGIFVSFTLSLVVLFWLIARESSKPFEDTIDALEEKNAGLVAEIEEIRAENEKWEADYNKLFEEVPSLNRQIHKLFAVENELNAKLAAAQGELAVAKSALSESKDAYIKLHEAHEALQAEKEAMERDLTSTKAKIGGLSRHIKDLEEKISNNAHG